MGGPVSHSRWPYASTVIVGDSNGASPPSGSSVVIPETSIDEKVFGMDDADDGTPEGGQKAENYINEQVKNGTFKQSDIDAGNGKTPSQVDNTPTTEKPKLKPSNGADKGVEAKEKSGTSIPTPETAKKLEKQIKDRSEDKKKRTIYAKEKVPVDTKSAVNESSTKFSSLINEEIQKMKNLSSYDKKTQ